MKREAEAIKAFKAKLAAFVAAGQSLAVAWGDLESADADYRLTYAVSKWYPFRKDFIEILVDMDKWKDHVKTIDALGVLDWWPPEDA